MVIVPPVAELYCAVSAPPTVRFALLKSSEAVFVVPADAPSVSVPAMMLLPFNAKLPPGVETSIAPAAVTGIIAVLPKVVVTLSDVPVELKLTPAPPRLYPFPVMVMEFNVVAAGKSFVFVNCAAFAGKTRSGVSAGFGAIPPLQLAPVVQLLFTALWPDHVLGESPTVTLTSIDVGLTVTLPVMPGGVEPRVIEPLTPFGALNTRYVPDAAPMFKPPLMFTTPATLTVPFGTVIKSLPACGVSVGAVFNLKFKPPLAFNESAVPLALSNRFAGVLSSPGATNPPLVGAETGEAIGTVPRSTPAPEIVYAPPVVCVALTINSPPSTAVVPV